MTRLSSISAWFLLPVLLIGSVNADQAAAETEKTRPGDHSLTLTAGGLKRHYSIHVPPGCDLQKPLPLVIMFHGGGGTGRGAALESGWPQKAGKEGFLAVFPDATPPDPAKPARFGTNGQIWNDGSGRFHAVRQNIPDVAFINAMIDDLIARFNVNPRRIYATGFSNGASMAFRVGVELSARIAAIAPVAGALWIKQPKLNRPVSLYYITGDADPLNPFAGGVPRFSTGSASLDMIARRKPAARENVVAWARMLNCQPETRQETPASPGITTEVFIGECNGSEVRFTVIKNHGHIWPGGRNQLPESLVGKASGEFNATEAIWEFFQKHSLPEQK